MVLVDANVLLHASNDTSPQHPEAHQWLANALGGNETVGFAWMVLLAFLRVSTHPAIFPRPLALDDAGQLVEDWIAAPRAVVLDPTRRHLALLRGLLSSTGARGNLVSDAHLAALALEHDATVVSFDRDFGRFEGVRAQLLA